MIEGDAATSPASAVDARSGCGLGWPIPIFPCQCRPRITRLRKVPRATDDAGGIVVVVREVQPIWCFEDAGSGTSSQVKSSVRTEKWSPATFTEPSSSLESAGSQSSHRGVQGNFPTLFLAPGAEDGAIMNGIVGLFGWTWGTKRMECRGGLEGKNKTKITMSTREGNGVGPKDKRREGREENKSSGRAHCQGS